VRFRTKNTFSFSSPLFLFFSSLPFFRFALHASWRKIARACSGKSPYTRIYTYSSTLNKRNSLEESRAAPWERLLNLGICPHTRARVAVRVYVKQHPVASHVFHKIHLVPIPTPISPGPRISPSSYSSHSPVISVCHDSALRVSQRRRSILLCVRAREVIHATLRRNPVALPGLSRDHLATTFLTFLIIGITVPIEIIARLRLGIIESTYDLS